MSPQIEFLRRLIVGAKRGRPAAISLLRDLVQKATLAAPPDDLITLADCLADIGDDLTRKQIERN